MVGVVEEEEKKEEEEADQGFLLLRALLALGDLHITPYVPFVFVCLVPCLGVACGLRVAWFDSGFMYMRQSSRQFWRRFPSPCAWLPKIGTSLLVVSCPTGTQKSSSYRVSGCQCPLHLCFSAFLAFLVASIMVSLRWRVTSRNSVDRARRSLLPRRWNCSWC